MPQKIDSETCYDLFEVTPSRFFQKGDPKCGQLWGGGGWKQIFPISTFKWICNLINLGDGIGVWDQEVGEGGSPNPSIKPHTH